jgi:Na+/melibiose symporter-like transporter
MDLRHFADLFGGIPLFILLILYFYNKKGGNEKILFYFCSFALIVDIYLSFFYKDISVEVESVFPVFTTI